MKTVEAIFADAPKVRDILRQQSHYFAHTSAKDSEKADELLDEHVELVNLFVRRLCEKHGLNQAIDLLINDVIKGVSFFEGNEQSIGEMIKERFVYSFLFHDFGKINVNFQREKMKKTNLFPKEAKVPFKPAHGHSELSTYFYLRYFSPKSLNEKESLLFYLTILFSYPIVRHHASGLWEISKFFENRKFEWIKNEMAFEQLQKQYDLNIEQPLEYFQQMIKNVDGILNFGDTIFQEKNFQLFTLIKLCFSLLTASDYLATSVYANDKDYTIAGTINDELRKRIISATRSSASYNTAIFNALEDENFTFKNPKEKGNKQLNRLRFEMGVSTLQNLKKHIHQKIFYIEAPTGGGKTNLSMLATAELLRLKPELNKVIYVFPFTTLVTQTFTALQQTFGLKDTEITQLHSKAGYKQGKTDEEGEDGYFGDAKQDYLTYLFNHFPVSLCTHIRFFDWMKTERKENNYAFHRLANSIVVIDELQAYPPHHWDKIIFFIQQFSVYFNTHFIIMSATLPKLGELLPELGISGTIHSLLPRAKELYFKNPNFKERVHFDTSLLAKKIEEEDELAGKILEVSKIYAANNTVNPQSVYCIVECIFKQTATNLFNAIAQQPVFFDHVWVLSGTILEHRRRIIINRLKNKKYREKRILLITTQVVEAGVDIDMDIGFKNQSILDSDEQLAGRINRNVNKDTCKLFLFRKDKASILYDKDARFSLSQQHLNVTEIKNILQEKDFDCLYKMVFDEILKNNKLGFTSNFRSFMDTLTRLNFQEISKDFRLIDNKNLSLFVPVKVPIEIESSIEGEKEYMFNKDELYFLRQNGVECQEYVNGEQVFDLFIQRIKKDVPINDYIQNKTDFIRLKGIMSRFIFSMFASDKFERLIQKSIHPEKSESGYIYLLHHEEIYDKKTGLNQAAIDDVTQQIIG